MGTFTTQEATDYLRACLARPKNPTPFVVIEYAHKRQDFSEIMTRLQGHFGFHDHQPSLLVVARDAVCNVYLERVRVEQVENYKGWARRHDAAVARVDSGQYGYIDPQDEEEGISLFAIEQEMGQLAAEYKLTLEECEAAEAAIDAERKRRRYSRRRVMARVEPEPAKLVEVAADRPVGIARFITATVSFHAKCVGCGYKVRGKTDSAFARELQNTGWIATEAGLLCVECAPRPVEMTIAVADLLAGDIFNGSPVVEVAEWTDDKRPSLGKGRKIACEAGGVYWYFDHNKITVTRMLAPLKISTCAKCQGETTGELIPVDKDDFNVKTWNGVEWIPRPGVEIARLICSLCCRG